MVSVGSLNVVQALIDAELRIAVLERVVEQLINSQPNLGQKMNIDEKTMEAIRNEALTLLQEKYPDLNIKLGQA